VYAVSADKARVSNHEATDRAFILRDAAEFIIGRRFAPARWRLLRMRNVIV
jgi:hypothetical protein